MEANGRLMLVGMLVSHSHDCCSFRTLEDPLGSDRRREGSGGATGGERTRERMENRELCMEDFGKKIDSVRSAQRERERESTFMATDSHRVHANTRHHRSVVVPTE